MSKGRWINRVRKIFQKRALVLMYHRIAETVIDPWQLSVSRENFELHLQILTSSFNVISATQLVEQVRNNAVQKNSICLTFDDGYSDNYLAARPVLEKFQCPATYFIATRFTGVKQEFWWDALVGIFLETIQLPELLELRINAEPIDYHLVNNGTLQPDELIMHRHWYWPGKPPTQRCEIYLAVWERLKPLPFQEIDAVLNQLKRWAGSQYQPDADKFPMTADQLDELFKHPLIDIGIHTDTHPALSFHSKENQEIEIGRSKKLLEAGIRSVGLIAYPYGNFNETTLEIVKELKLGGAFTTSETVVHRKTDPFKLGRFQVKNLDGQQFSRHLNNWLSEA